MVGSAVCKKLLKAGYGDPSKGGLILNPSRKTLNLTNGKEVEDWFTKNKPTVVIVAAKVGGILANSISPVDFLLENLKIQNNLIILGKKMSKDLFFRKQLYLSKVC